MSVSEVFPGASKRAPIAERVASATCTRRHVDPAPCYDLAVDDEVADPIFGIEGGVVHIPGCMGCAVYGHESCTCAAGAG